MNNNHLEPSEKRRAIKVIIARKKTKIENRGRAFVGQEICLMKRTLKFF